jgi:hypothetical protein
MADLNERTRRAVESVLENESLTADLDDAAAQALLNWSVACARQIMQETGPLDDEQAEITTAPRMKAVRKLMRIINAWFSQPGDDTAQLDSLLDQAMVIYGPSFIPPDAGQRQVCLAELAAMDTSPQKIAHLQSFVEPSVD